MKQIILTGDRPTGRLQDVRHAMQIDLEKEFLDAAKI